MPVVDEAKKMYYVKESTCIDQGEVLIPIIIRTSDATAYV